MLDTADGQVYSGTFTVDGRPIAGELTFAGPNTRLLLHDAEIFRPNRVEARCIHGALRDLTRVSLLDCIAPSVAGRHWSQHLGTYFSGQVDSHYVLHGRRHLSPSDRLIRSVTVVLKDAPSIFQDYRSFSSIFAPDRKRLKALLDVEAKRNGIRVRLGPRPFVAYFTGRTEIFKARTVVGTVSAHHEPGLDFGGPKGVAIDSRIGLTIDFSRLHLFSEAVEAVVRVLGFFEIIAGRRQEIEHFSLRLKAKEPLLDHLDVFWVRPPRRHAALRSEASLHSLDLPLDAVRDPKGFARVMSAWMSQSAERRDARGRFSLSFCRENSFDADRLIGSANMFDLLPDSAVPQTAPLDPEVQKARDAARALFRPLPPSLERESLLNALGRLGKASLKHKVRYRAQSVIDILPDRMPNLLEVLDLAVDARNHYVHGSASDIDYEGRFAQTIPFLTRSLEFVFVASDLQEAGWDISDWYGRGSTLSHPMSSFVYSYDAYLRAFKAALPPGHRFLDMTEASQPAAVPNMKQR